MKRVAALALALLLTLSLAACGQTPAKSAEPTPAAGTATPEGTGTPTEGKALSDIKIVYVTSDLSNEIFAMQVEAMQKYCEGLGVQFDYIACMDTGAKISAIENYITAGVDTIICHVSDGPAMESVMKEAQAAGIKFFAYDADVEGSDAYYGWKNYDLGVAIGQNAANWVNANFAEDETVYAASANYPSFNFLVEREQGYMDTLNELCKAKIEWVAEGVGGTASNGVTAGENFLQTGKDINLVVGINDGGCLGVYEAFKAAGYGGDKVAIFGCDATTDGVNAVAEGGIYRGTISTDLINLAPEFIDIAVRIAQGGEGGPTYGPTTLITPENAKDFQ